MRVVLLAPAVVTLARVSTLPATLVVVACWAGGVLSLMTGYAGFVTSYTVFCMADRPTAAADASCAASTGALAAIFGVIGVVATLPFAVRLRRRSS